MGIDILIPALGRPYNIPPLMESLKTSSERHRVIFICSPGDLEQIAACQATEAETWITDWPAGRADFAKKCNWAFSRTETEYVFQGATDVKFYPGWDAEVLKVAHSTQKSVIGTNDLHNPRVKRHKQSTHTLFRRSYIEEVGGSLDGPGTVFSEAYDHQYVDVEVCELARRRGQWAFAERAIVEHLHPHWGLADEDATYRKATRKSASDRRLYASRMTRGSLQRQKRMKSRSLRDIR